MRLKTFIPCAACALLLAAAATGCDSSPETGAGGGAPASASAGGPAAGTQSTQITSALPDAGFRAVITAPDAPTRLRAGEPKAVEARVRNAGPVVWPAMGADDARWAITLRNRWLKPETLDVVNDLDGGTSLPYDVAAGAEVPMSIKVVAPRQPGDYVLELDMVQEQVSFFGDKGSQPLRLNVKVE
jgi:hypothetical protein